MSHAGWQSVGDERFDATAAVGGVRGIIESSAPGIVFVVAFLGWGGFQVPTIAAVATMVVAVAVRLVQRQPISPALGGVVGVVIGAVWAWIAGEPSEYFVPGFVTNAITAVVLTASIVARWPVVGFVLAAARGASLTAWRADAHIRAVCARGTVIMAVMFAFKLAVQVPLYLANQVAVLGVGKLAMGVPLFALTAWIVWNVVRSVELPQGPPDLPQPKE